MKPEEYPVEPPKGISHFPQGVLYLIKQEDTGKEEVKIKRISGDEFEFEITPKKLSKAEQKDFPIRICEYEKPTEEEPKEKPKEIIKSEKKVDITVSPKQIIKIADGQILKIGNTITYTAGTDLITVSTDTYTLDQINTAIADDTHWQKNGEGHYCKANLLITSSGKIIDENSSFQLGSNSVRKTFETTAGTEFKLERCLIAFYLSARKGSWGLWEFKKSTIIEVSSANIPLHMRGTQNHSDSVFQITYWYNRDGTCSYDNCKVYNSSGFYYYTSGTINLLSVSGGVMSYYNSPTFKNTTMASNYCIISAGIHATMINTVWGSLTLSNANNYLLEKWEFNILVKDDNNNVITGANVELKDKYGDVKHIGMTGVDGKLASAWEVLANRYDGTSETKTEYNPFTLKVTKGADETEYKIVIDHIIKEDVVLMPQSVASYDNIMAGITDIKGTGFCYSDDTEVLTENGWKLFKELDKDEAVTTLNAEKDELEYQIPTKHFVFDTDKTMCSYEGQSTNFMVTSNHRMWIRKEWNGVSPQKWEFKTAKELIGKNFEVKKDVGNWRGQEPKYFILPQITYQKWTHNGQRYFDEIETEKKFLYTDWLKFFGFWLAEGHTNNSGKTHYRVGLSNKDLGLLNEMKDILKSFGFNPILTKRDNKCSDLTVNNKQLWTYLMQFGKALDKYIPKETKTLSKKYLEILFKYMMYGDGWSNGYGYATSSYCLAGDVQEILLKMGLAGNILKSTLERDDKKFIAYTVTVLRKRVTPLINRKKTYKEVEYSGNTYCVEVPNGIVYVRRNGRAMWSGNSKDTDSLVDIRPETDKIQTGIIDAKADFKATGFATQNPPSQNLNDYKANVSNLDVAVSTRNATTPPTTAAIKNELEGVGTKLTTVKDQTDKLQFAVGNDIKATLDSETVTTDAASRTASKATGFATATALSTHDTKLDTVDANVDRILKATEIKQCTVNDAGASTTKFITSLTETDNNFWDRGAVRFTSGNNDGQVRAIKNYAGGTKQVTIQTPLNSAPANGDTFIILTSRKFLTPDIGDILEGITDIQGTGFVKDLHSLKPISDTVTTMVADTEAQLSGTHGAGSWESAAIPDIADAVWDEDLSGHTTAGTAGKILGAVKKIVNAILGLIA